MSTEEDREEGTEEDKERRSRRKKEEEIALEITIFLIFDEFVVETCTDRPPTRLKNDSIP